MTTEKTAPVAPPSPYRVAAGEMRMTREAVTVSPDASVRAEHALRVRRIGVREQLATAMRGLAADLLAAAERAEKYGTVPGNPIAGSRAVDVTTYISTEAALTLAIETLVGERGEPT